MSWGVAACSDLSLGNLKLESTMIRRSLAMPLGLMAVVTTGVAQVPADTARKAPVSILLAPDAVWDGVGAVLHPGWVVLVTKDRIDTMGPADQVRATKARGGVDPPGTTLIPGLIEGHSHLFLHPYNEATWDDQVLREPV